jgi:hypothetical protein
MKWKHQFLENRSGHSPTFISGFFVGAYGVYKYEFIVTQDFAFK